jgi:hypothetical protein
MKRALLIFGLLLTWATLAAARTFDELAPIEALPNSYDVADPTQVYWLNGLEAPQSVYMQANAASGGGHLVTAYLGMAGVGVSGGYSNDAGNALYIFFLPIVTPANMTNPSWGSNAYMNWSVVDSGTPAWGLALYSDSSGSPGSVLCAANTSTVATANAWNGLALSGCGTPASNTPYWLSVTLASNTQAFIKSFGACHQGTLVYLGGPLSSFPLTGAGQTNGFPNNASTTSPASDVGDGCPPAYIPINYTSTAPFDIIGVSNQYQTQNTPTKMAIPALQSGDALILGTMRPNSAVTFSGATDAINGTTTDTFTQAGSCPGVTSGAIVCLLYVVPATAGVNSVTANFGCSPCGDYHNNVFVMEVKGLHSLDKTAYDTSYETVSSSGGSFSGSTTSATSSANELAVGAVYMPFPFSSDMCGYFTGTSGWDAFLSFYNPGTGLETLAAGFYQSVSSTGSYGVTGTYTDLGCGGGPWSIATGIATFQ